MASRTDELTERFAQLRPHLMRVAYGTLGSVSDAEDVVQDAWLRLERMDDVSRIGDLHGYLTKTVSRLALDALTTARARRERYVGPWLPEPLVGDAEPEPGPAERVTLDETVSMALMVVLEQLSPAERTSFVLHDVFGVPFEEVAEVVGRTPEAVRQLASRARRRVQADRASSPVSRARQSEVVTAFAEAASAGDFEALLRLLDPDVVWRTDGGGVALASRRPQHGAPKVARGMIALASRPPLGGTLVDVNGAPGILLRDPDGVLSVMAFTLDDGRITAIDVIRNPQKLRHVQPPF